MKWCNCGKVTWITISNLIKGSYVSRLSDLPGTRNFPQLTRGLRAWYCNTLGRDTLRCWVWHGRRRWFQKICESMLRSNVFAVGSSRLFYNSQPKHIQLANIVESTEIYSVGKHRRISWKVFSWQTSWNQVKSIQLANIVESTEKGSVMGSTEIST